MSLTYQRKIWTREEYDITLDLTEHTQRIIKALWPAKTCRGSEVQGIREDGAGNMKISIHISKAYKFLPLQPSNFSFTSPLSSIDIYFLDHFSLIFLAEAKHGCDTQNWKCGGGGGGIHLTKWVAKLPLLACFQNACTQTNSCRIWDIYSREILSSLGKRPLNTDICGLYFWYKPLTGHHL